MINVLQITHDLEFGGLQQVVVNMCLQMDRSRYNLTVLSLNGEGPLTHTLENNGITVKSLNIKAPDYLTFLKIARYMRTIKLDVIHTHNTQPFIEGGLASILSLPFTSTINTDHSRVFPFSKKYMIAERLMSLHFKHVVAVSKSTANDLIHKVGISPSKITTIPNGIDINRFAGKFKNIATIKPSGPDEKIIGYVGRIVEGKGIQYLIRAVNLLVQDGINARLVIVGEGEYKEDLLKLAGDLEVSDRIEYVGPKSDVERYYGLFDVFVLPSLSEGLPVVLLEAMAANCPVLSTDVGGVREVIEDGVSGVIVQPHNPDEIALNLKKILTNESFARDLAANGFRTVSTAFSLETMADSYGKLYRSSCLGNGTI